MVQRKREEKIWFARDFSKLIERGDLNEMTALMMLSKWWWIFMTFCRENLHDGRGLKNLLQSLLKNIHCRLVLLSIQNIFPLYLENSFGPLLVLGTFSKWHVRLSIMPQIRLSSVNWLKRTFREIFKLTAGAVPF